MILDLQPAAIDDAPLLRNLGELYAYDWSEITLAEVNAEGRFDRDFWSGCWTGKRTPYLFRVDGQLAGFAIVARGSRLTDDPQVFDLAEFFVLRKYRRHGVGARVAVELFGRHRGRWEVRERANNLGARDFWRKVIATFTGGRFEEEHLADSRWTGWVQRFESGGAASML